MNVENRLQKYQVKDWLGLESMHWRYIDSVLDDSFIGRSDIETRLRKDVPLDYVWPMVAFLRESLPEDVKHKSARCRTVVLYGLGCVAYDFLRVKYPDISFTLAEVLDFIQSICQERYPNHLFYIASYSIPTENLIK